MKQVQWTLTKVAIRKLFQVVERRTTLNCISHLVDHHMNYYFESRLGIQIIFGFIWSISCHHELLLTGRNLQHDVYNRNIDKLPLATRNSELFWNSDPLNSYFSTFWGSVPLWNYSTSCGIFPENVELFYFKSFFLDTAASTYHRLGHSHGPYT